MQRKASTMQNFWMLNLVVRKETARLQKVKFISVSYGEYSKSITIPLKGVTMKTEPRCTVSAMAFLTQCMQQGRFLSITY